MTKQEIDQARAALASYWAGSASASVQRAYREGNVRVVVCGQSAKARKR